jgi:RNA polymerase sigma-54 factor
MTPQLVMRPSPALLAFVQMLALPATELEDLVEREVAENPALERVEPPCGATIGDLSAVIADRASPQAQLLADVTAEVPGDDRAIAEYVVASLDERGFLDAGTDDLACALDVDAERVERVLRVVRAVGPPGVGARDVRECLLLQLEQLDDGNPVALARRLVAEQLEELARGRLDAVAAALGVTRDDVDDAVELMRTRLRPYPDLGVHTAAAPVVADVVVTERPEEPGTYDVALAEDERLGLGLNPLYERLAAEPASLTDDERARVAAQVAQARSFIERVGRRRATLRRVACVTIARQRAFMHDGAGALLPLTRAEVAHELELHESTVSRTVAGRYVQLPSERVVPFADFFRASLGAEETLTRLVAEEERPHSDKELAELLATSGFTVARRTVAKYRSRLGILPVATR